MREKMGELRAGWRVIVAASAGIGVGYAMFITSAGLFVVPMQEEFGWSRVAVSIGPMVGLITALLGPFAGIILDRAPLRPIAVIGLILLSAAFVGMAVAPAEAWALYSLVIAFGVIGTITSSVIYCKVLSSWFTQRAGTALALALSGVSIVAAITQPLLAYVIAQCGWRFGFLVLAGIVALAGLPTILAWLQVRPGSHVRSDQAVHVLAGARARAAIRDRRFYLIILAFSIAAIPIGGFIGQLQPIFLSKGFSIQMAAAYAVLFMVASAFGRVSAGALFDRFEASRVAGSILVLSAMGSAVVWLSDSNAWLSIALGIVAVGIAQGAEADFIAYFTLRTFGPRSFSTLFGIVATAIGLSVALGGVLFSGVYDRFGDYQIALLASVVSFVLSAIVVGLIKLPRVDVHVSQASDAQGGR